MIHELLKNKKVILASVSPRRKEIFNMLGVNFLQLEAPFEETIEDTDHVNPRKFVQNHARQKVQSLSCKMDEDCLIIGADTIVYHQETILGKPGDYQQAYEYLMNLAGNYHQVYTGIAVSYQGKVETDFTRTKVKFIDLTDTEIKSYLATKESFDKAGAYGIQGYGSQFIESVSGCYFNVMGFPVTTFYQLLKRMLG